MRQFAEVLSLLMLFAATPLQADSTSEDAWLRKVQDAPETMSHGYGALEATAISMSHGRTERRGDTLILHLANGKSAKLKDDESCPEGRTSFEANCFTFRLVADLPSRHFVFVEQTFYEGSALLLFDDRTGNRTKIHGYPTFAPSGGRFIAIDTDLGYGDGSIEIWIRNGDGAQVEWKFSDSREPASPLARVIRWSGNRIDLDLWVPTSDGSPDPHWPGVLIHDTSGWRLETKWPQDLK